MSTSKKKIAEIYHRPLIDLVYEAQSLHRQYHDPNRMQKSTLISIKTGKCPEDCKYCSQSAHYKTKIKDTDLMKLNKVKEKAKKVKINGSSRLCLGSSGTRIRDGEEFDNILNMIKEVKNMGLETCVTLGMVAPQQAKRLKEAGLDYYNHNLDTSPEYYQKITTTRTYQERLDTLKYIREAGIQVCTGGILGMGETVEDRISFLFELANLSKPPESVTINKLVPIKGTPLSELTPINPLEVVRTIATARLLMPESVIRLSAGRESMSEEMQALCILAGANSMFAGDKLLTTPNAGDSKDEKLFKNLGLKSIKPFETQQKNVV